MVPIPASLLTDCYVPQIPDAMTYGDAVVLNVTLLLSIENCNGQLDAIRQIEKTRASQ